MGVGSCSGHEKGITIVETLITLCLIAVLVGVVVPKYQRVAREAQETALKAGLTNIRLSITLFKMLNNRNPKDINELTEKEVMLPARIGRDPYTGSIFKQKYLIPQVKDANGNILDAFGNPFLYDAARGEVKSSTKGYETW
jgi:type II secretory pathway pseudopilin PulG